MAHDLAPAADNGGMSGSPSLLDPPPPSSVPTTRGGVISRIPLGDPEAGGTDVGLPMGSRSGRRLGQAVLAYLIVATLFVTWAPFRFATAPVQGFSGIWTPSDLVLNVVMFLPLGFLWQSARVRHGGLTWWMVGLGGAMMSLTIEVGQLFIVERFPSWLDVLTNGTGAALGARLFDSVRPRVHLGASTVSALALELPLTGLVILLTPLLWVSGFGSFGTERVWLLVPVGAFGGAVLGVVHGAHLHHTGRVGRGALLGTVAAWFLVSALPGAISRPDVLAAGMTVAVGSAWLRSVGTARARQGQGDRRVELPTLRLVLPLFALYLVLSALWPLEAMTETWNVGWTLAPATTQLSRTMLLQGLEYLAAFTLVGYMTAEYHGRWNRSYAVEAPRVLGVTLALAFLLEMGRGWSALHGASGSMSLLAVGAGLFGGWLYHLQRDHVVTLLSRVGASRIRPPEG